MLSTIAIKQMNNIAILSRHNIPYMINVISSEFSLPIQLFSLGSRGNKNGKKETAKRDR